MRLMPFANDCRSMGAEVKGVTNGLATDPLTLTQWVLVQQQKEVILSSLHPSNLEYFD